MVNLKNKRFDQKIKSKKAAKKAAKSFYHEAQQTDPAVIWDF